MKDDCNRKMYDLKGGLEMGSFSISVLRFCVIVVIPAGRTTALLLAIKISWARLRQILPTQLGVR